MTQAFDVAWQQVAGNFGDDSTDAERARLRFARARLSSAHGGGRDVSA